jgi:hypothetical protein
MSDPINRFTGWLFSLVIILAVAHVSVVLLKHCYVRDHLLGLTALFHFNSGESLSVWYSCVILASCAVLSFAIYRQQSFVADKAYVA